MDGPTYGIDACTERRRQCISDLDIGHPLITAMRQAIGRHAILRDPGFATSFNTVEKTHVSFPIFVANLLKNFQCRAEPL